MLYRITDSLLTLRLDPRMERRWLVQYLGNIPPKAYP